MKISQASDSSVHVAFLADLGSLKFGLHLLAEDVQPTEDWCYKGTSSDGFVISSRTVVGVFCFIGPGD